MNDTRLVNMYIYVYIIVYAHTWIQFIPHRQNLANEIFDVCSVGGGGERLAVKLHFIIREIHHQDNDELFIRARRQRARRSHTSQAAPAQRSCVCVVVHGV